MGLWADRQNLYAGTKEGGVFRSTDNGASWTAAITGLANRDAHASARNAAGVFAGTWGGGVILTTDGAASWCIRLHQPEYPQIISYFPPSICPECSETLQGIKSSAEDMATYLREHLTDTTFYIMTQQPTIKYTEHITAGLGWAW